MAMMEARDILNLTPTILRSPGTLLWSRYDREADVLYVNFEKPAVATDSELSEDDVIVRYRGDKVIGYTILHASTRHSPA